MTSKVIQQWLRYMESGDDTILDDLVDKDAVFYSPAVFSPQEGHTKVCAYLAAAERMFAGTNFRYVSQWHSGQSAVLEFTADLEGMHVNGVDIITWNDNQKITSFKVMVRPLRGLQTVIPLMGNLLSSK